MRALLLLLALTPPLAAQDPPPETPAPPLGRGAAFGVLDAGPAVVVAAGTALRSRPDVTAEILVRVPETLELPVFDRHGDWVKTHYGDWTGWLAPDGEKKAIDAHVRALELSPMVLDTSLAERAARVSSARSLFARENPSATTLGPWPLYTDVFDASQLGRLERIAAALPGVYAERFGLQPNLDQPPAIVLFARESDYRRFTAEHTEVGELHGGGHANDAMAALYAEGTLEEVAAVLVHELTHLLNRRRFAEPPRTWVEEGLANDLGLSRLLDDGGLEPGSLGGELTTVAHRSSDRRVTLDTRITGGHASWIQLLRQWKERRQDLDRLPALLDMSWSDFVEPRQRTWHYGQSTFFVRYLLDHAPADRREAFRGFLRAAAAGGPSGADALAQALGTTPRGLQNEFERWLTTSLVLAR